MPELIDAILWQEAMNSFKIHQSHVKNSRYVSVIDYRQPSGEPRYYLIDLKMQTLQVLHVAHGKGSDPDHDGVADVFSNTLNSKMTSLGAFVTGDIYYGQHGISLKLHGLEPSNDKAEERLIVIHGASYVGPHLKKMGRSWGCPALGHEIAKDVIPRIAGGSFIYAVGR